MSTEDDLAKQLLEHIQGMNATRARQTVFEASYTVAELAQAKSGYLIYKSSKRIERASYVLAGLTVVLIAVTLLLLFRH